MATLIAAAPRQRIRCYTGWVETPLTTLIQQEIDARNWTITDLAHAMEIAPSVVSRWMSGTRPTPESLRALALALGLDYQRLLYAAGYETSDPFEDDGDPRRAAIIAKVRLIEFTDERYFLLSTLLEAMRRRKVGPLAAEPGFVTPEHAQP